MLDVLSIPEIESVENPRYRAIDAASTLDALMQEVDTDPTERPAKDRVYSLDRRFGLDRPAVFWALDCRNTGAHAPLKFSDQDYDRAAKILLRAIHQLLPHVSAEIRLKTLGPQVETTVSTADGSDTTVKERVTGDIVISDDSRLSSPWPAFLVFGCVGTFVLFMVSGILSKPTTQESKANVPQKVMQSVDRTPPKISTSRSEPLDTSSNVPSASEVRRQQQAEAELARQREREHLERSRAKHAAISPRAIPKSATAEQIEFAQSPTDFASSIGLELRLVPSGKFTMGSSMHSHAEAHAVEIRHMLYVAAHETTQREYKAVTGILLSQNDGIVRPNYPPGWAPSPTQLSDPHARDNLPAENVSWDDAVSFCKALTSRDQGAGILAKNWEYRLPTEAEWEYAARAGSKSEWCFGDNEGGILNFAWTNRTAGGKTHLVGQKQPNAWGLYDVHGNVWEWCQDWFGADYYRNSTAVNPGGASGGAERVIRGGSFSNDSARCGSAERGHIPPTTRVGNVGFRVVLSINSPPQRQPFVQSADGQQRKPNLKQPKIEPDTGTNAQVEGEQVVNKPTGPRLGVTAKKCPEGIHIETIIKDSAATRCIDVGSREQLQLEPGDHILSVNGIEPKTYDEFLQLIATSGQEMSFIVKDQHNQKLRRMTTTLAW